MMITSIMMNIIYILQDIQLAKRFPIKDICYIYKALLGKVKPYQCHTQWKGQCLCGRNIGRISVVLDLSESNLLCERPELMASVNPIKDFVYITHHY